MDFRMRLAIVLTLLVFASAACGNGNSPIKPTPQPNPTFIRILGAVPNNQCRLYYRAAGSVTGGNCHEVSVDAEYRITGSYPNHQFRAVFYLSVDGVAVLPETEYIDPAVGQFGPFRIQRARPCFSENSRFSGQTNYIIARLQNLDLSNPSPVRTWTTIAQDVFPWTWYWERWEIVLSVSPPPRCS